MTNSLATSRKTQNNYYLRKGIETCSTFSDIDIKEIF